MSKEKKKANLFSLQGWEAGLLLELALSNNFLESGTEQFIQNLYNQTISGPRGRSILDPLTHNIIAPVHQVILQKGNSTSITRSIDDPIHEWKDFVKNEKAPASSGWLNTYLCY
jgi:hypothetical protein